MKKFITLAAAGLMVSAASLASAASFSLSAVATAAYDPAFNPLPVVDTTTMDGNDRVFQVDFHITTTDVQVGERGFGNVGFNIVLTPGLVDPALNPWQPSTQQTDSNGALPGGLVAVWSTNADAGPSGTDLLGIFASIASGIANPNASDGRVKIGQPGGPSFVGSVFVPWDAESLQAVSTGGSLFSTYLTNGTFASPPAPGGEALLVLGTAIPEPATVAMAGMGLIGIVAMRRRRIS